MFILIIFANQLFSQIKHLIFSDSISPDFYVNIEGNEITYKKNSANKLYHVLVMDKNKSIAYYDKFDNSSKTNSITDKIKIFNKRKHSVKYVEYVYNEDKVDFKINNKIPSKKIDDKFLRETYEFSEFEKQFFKNKYPDYKIPEYVMSFEKINKTKNINGFNCKQGKITLYDNRVYEVWYCEDFNYNWSFDNFVSIIPGTVIQVSENDKVVFKLEYIGETDFNKIIFTKSQLKMLLADTK